MNVVILFAVLSVANSCVFGSSRLLASLAAQGQAPRPLAYIDRKGRPLVAIAIASAFGLLAYLYVSPAGNSAFTWLLALSGLSSLFTWGTICYSHIRFRKAWAQQGHSIDSLIYKSPVGTIGSWIGLIMIVLVLIAQFWVAVDPIGNVHTEINTKISSFFEAYLAMPVVLIFYAGYKLWYRTRWMKIEDIDLRTGRNEVDAGMLYRGSRGWQRREMEGRQTFITRLSTLDFGGQFLFLFGMGLFILAITWAGAYYPWSDAKVIVPLVLGSLLVILFLVWEYLMMPGSALALRYPYRRAMLPFNLILSRNSGLLMYINFITGMAMYAVFYFVDIYFALVLQFSSSEGGKNLLYYIPGLAVGVYLAMFACNVFPRQTWYPLFLGTVIEPLGITILAAALSWGHLPTIYGMLALTGVGTGIRLMPGTLHAIGHYPTQIAPLVSMMSLSSSLGGTLALTIMLNIFNNHLSSSGISVSGTTTASFSGIATLESAEQDYVRKMAKEGIVLAFYAISAFLWLGVGASAALGNAWIAKGGGEEVGRTCEGSFLGSLLSRKRRSNAEKA